MFPCPLHGILLSVPIISLFFGSLPRKAAKIVRQWALDHGDELMANWQRGVDLEPMEMIQGADVDD